MLASAAVNSETAAPPDAPERRDFIRDIVAADLAAGRVSTPVTRFPPEPNGHLHIGHAKSICLNFGIASEFGGRCHLRFDDTNPEKEEQAYIDAIEADVRWLGFDWGDNLFHASDYFEQLYAWAVHLIETGLAYVDDQTADETRETRGTLTTRRHELALSRPVASRRTSTCSRACARASSPTARRCCGRRSTWPRPTSTCATPCCTGSSTPSHPRTGDAWCIYPTYDMAHGQSDAIEGVTHSICTLEFENHRPLYDWLIEHLPVPHVSRQIEFARLNLTWTVLSKRVLLRLVNEGHVRGWDDPRMPTISGLRRRGFPAEGIRDFATEIGVSKADSVHEIELLEHSVRSVLNRTAPRRFGVLDPLKVVITNYPEGQSESMEVVNNPEDPSAGTRGVEFGRELWIEREDFMEEPAPKFFRLAPGREVRLRNAYFVTCKRSSRAMTIASSSSGARTTPRPAAATPPTAARSRRRSTGSRRPTPSRPRCGCTTTSSRGPTRAPTATCSRTSTRRPRRSSAARCSSRRSQRRRSARRSSSSAWATSRRTATRGRTRSCSTGR